MTVRIDKIPTAVITRKWEVTLYMLGLEASSVAVTLSYPLMWKVFPISNHAAPAQKSSFSVLRRYSDFLWLYEMISRPTISTPLYSLSSFTLFGNAFDYLKHVMKATINLVDTRAFADINSRNYWLDHIAKKGNPNDVLLN